MEVLICLVAAALLPAKEARADDRSGGPAGYPATPLAPGPQFPPPALTDQQLTAFAEIVDEPRPQVLQRLQMDPELVHFAVVAADARGARRSSGKVRTVIGFSILAVGGLTGAVITLTGFSSRDCPPNDDMCYPIDPDRLLIGLAILGASVGLGLGIGIPGLLSMTRQSQEERTAVERYHSPGTPSLPPVGGPAFSAGHNGLVVRVPLLSLSF
jgi:hypothetical protein